MPELVAHLRQEFARLKRQSRLDTAALGVLRAGEAGLDGELATVRRQLARAEADGEELRKSNDGLFRTTSRLQLELRELLDEKCRLEDDLAASEARVELVESELEKMEGNLDVVAMKQEETEQGRILDQNLLHMERAENTRIRQEALEVAMLMARKKKKRTRAKPKVRQASPPGLQLRMK